MPRSGTSWLSQLFDSSPEVRFRLSPLFSYAFKDWVDEESPKEKWIEFLEGAYESDNDFMRQEARRLSGEYPTFATKQRNPEFLVIKDTRFHNLMRPMLNHFENLKVICLIRNPCAAINSWLRNPGEFPPDADPMLEWRSGACRKTTDGEFWGFDDWVKVTRMQLAHEKAFPGRVKTVRYESLVNETQSTIDALFEFCDLQQNEQTRQFVRASQNRHDESPYAVFKSPDVAIKWRTQLEPEIRRSIEKELSGTELEMYLQ